jgi:SAM-dependent methyltransferase
MKKIFLHIGCGKKKIHQTPFASSEWDEIRMDADSSVSPDIVGNMTDMKQVETGSVDAVFSSHNLEHLYPHEVAIALAEFQRVLKPDGFLLITCPDLRSVCDLVAQDKLTEPAYQSGMGPICPVDILYGLRSAVAAGNTFMAHRTGFTETSLRQELYSGGFTVVASTTRSHCFDLWAIAADQNQYSEDQMRNLAQQYFFKPVPASVTASGSGPG